MSKVTGTQPLFLSQFCFSGMGFIHRQDFLLWDFLTSLELDATSPSAFFINSNQRHGLNHLGLAQVTYLSCADHRGQGGCGLIAQDWVCVHSYGEEMESATLKPYGSRIREEMSPEEMESCCQMYK